MICPNCNKENNPGVSFCVNCGTKLEVAPQQAPNTPPANPYEYKDPSQVNSAPYTPDPMPSSTQFAQDQFPNQNAAQNNNVANPPQPNITMDEATKINAKAKKLAIISLCLYIGRYVLSIVGAVLSGAITYLANYNSYSSSTYSYSSGISSILALLFSGLSFGCFVASLVLIIIAKVKVSSKKLKNTFVNAVFWVEMGLLIANVVLTIVSVFLLFAFCSAMITSCN